MHILSTTEVPAADIDRCLQAIEDGDPLITPFDVPPSARGQGLAAVDESGEVHAVGWLRPRGDLTEIDLRVAPGRRRSGVGKALYQALARPEAHLISSCDPAQRRAVKFLEARGFQLRSVLFAQRWDGEVADVPAAFRSAELDDAAEREDSWPILVESMTDSWPGPSIDRETFLDAQTRVRTASIEGQVVGVLAARHIGDAYSLGGLGILDGGGCDSSGLFIVVPE